MGRQKRPGTDGLMWICRWLAIGGIWLWAMAEFSQFVRGVRADDLAGVDIPAKETNPWLNASFPVENFIAYTSPFGYREHPFGGRRFHYGLDFAAPMGSYVRNWWPGTVEKVSDNTSCGASVFVKSGKWLHIYCHLQGYVVVETDGDRVLVDRAGKIEIKQGQSVQAGYPLGRVGMTGLTTGPHLHWGLKFDGNWVDPALVIKAMIEGQGAVEQQ